MKSYLRMLPVILYPYAYLIPLLVLFLTPAVDDNMAKVYLFVFGYGIAIHVLAFAASIYNAVITANGKKYDSRKAAQINVVTKCVQIPAYIFHFVLGCLGLGMSVWGIGVIIFAVVVDFLSILLTGISAIGLHVRMKKEQYLRKSYCVWLGIGSFLYCIDVAIAIFDDLFVTAQFSHRQLNSTSAVL